MGAVVETLVPFLGAITSLGDPGFILAASGGLVAALLAAGDRRTAMALALVIVTSAALTAAAKIGFMASNVAAVHSPSGHAASATTFFLCFGAIAAARKPAWVVGALCAALALAVAASRVGLGFHSPSEAAIGVGIGLCAFALFRRLQAPRPAIGRGPVAVSCAAAICLHALIGQSVDFEKPLELIAAALGRWAQ
ncbi:phosphatase PAP2 family protein [Methylosinus sp. Sm6]|uniref:phosphatase PAP2 family protein n=1 Tax=Methylosinus sp. Sm6 TaxID=2866948 RepID=UPI001C99C8F7|nr:phosphatase PAP2 family protein [Methylosinus sp. Sm6]MBY6241382.1 phosphatase PAP2 family protein [Methylosinus sp. Sm6]